MTRPHKTNADFFHHSSNMRQDPKVKTLRARFSFMGYAVWCYILETLTEADNFQIVWNDLHCDLMAADFGMAPEELREVVDYMKRLEMLTEADGVLFSEDLKQSFSALMQKRKRDRSYIRPATKTESVTVINADNSSETELSTLKTLQKTVINAENPIINADNSSETELSTLKTLQKTVINAENPEYLDESILYNNIYTSNISSSNIEEINKEEKENTKKKKNQAETMDPKEVVEMFNDMCKSLPKVLALNDSRRQKTKARLREIGRTPEQQREKLSELFTMMESSDFLTGKKTNWKATFDWFVANSANWVKVMEGNYRNHEPATAPAPIPTLGFDEFITGGRRTYGTGAVTIPMEAPPRPSARHCWDAASQTWLLL